MPEKVFFDVSKLELYFSVGSNLFFCDRENMVRLLVENQDVFAWSVYEAPRVSPDLAYHALNIVPNHKPVAQKRRKLALERANIVLEEVERLLAADTILEVQYPEEILGLEFTV